MFDTHAIARRLTDAGITPDHADAIVDAVRQAAEHDAVDVATRADLAALEARLYRFLLVQGAGIVGLTVAIIRLLD